jgi:hypothetical protein
VVRRLNFKVDFSGIANYFDKSAQLDRRKRDLTSSAACNERFGAMAAVARRQFCGKLNVIIPQQVQWKPPLPQAAGTLAVRRTTTAILQENK